VCPPRSHQREHVELRGSTREQIRTTAPELARTRARQDEAPAFLLDHPVHLVEQRRDLLDLVDDDPPLAIDRRELAGQERRLARQAERERGVEQIVGHRVGQDLGQPRRLAGSARAEQERRGRSFRRYIRQQIYRKSAGVLSYSIRTAASRDGAPLAR
jgi:hypothetical protein